MIYIILLFFSFSVVSYRWSRCFFVLSASFWLLQVGVLLLNVPRFKVQPRVQHCGEEDVDRHANGHYQGVVRHHWQISMAWSITIVFYEVELVWPLGKVLRATQNGPETMESLAMNFRENSAISWNSTSRETSRSAETDRNEEAYQHLEFLLSGFFLQQ